MSAAERAKPKILVTGANGQLGYELVRTLQSCGHVIAADRSVVDLGDHSQLRRAIREIRPDLIINPAAYTAVNTAEDDPDLAMRVNGVAPGVIAEEAHRLGASLIHYSTDYVFDGEKPGPYVESDAPCPLNVYGKSKLAGERAIEQVNGRHFVFRTSWVYGTRGTNFFLTMLALARKHESLRVVADQHGAPTWSATLADLTTAVVNQILTRDFEDTAWWSSHSGIYHISAGGETTWAGFAEAIFELVDRSPKPEVIPVMSAEYPSRVQRPHNSCLSNARLEQKFGVRAPHWREALEACSKRFAAEAADSRTQSD